MAGSGRPGTARTEADAPRAGSTEGPHEERHRDGSLRARGHVVGGRPVGCGEWFRLDGTELRSGWSDHGRPTGEWTTHDSSGAPRETATRG
ncbi:hypothetical protein ACI8AV_19620 [Geodermatophilus sp. SYSU D00804]